MSRPLVFANYDRASRAVEHYMNINSERIGATRHGSALLERFCRYPGMDEIAGVEAEPEDWPELMDRFAELEKKRDEILSQQCRGIDLVCAVELRAEWRAGGPDYRFSDMVWRYEFGGEKEGYATVGELAEGVAEMLDERMASHPGVRVVPVCYTVAQRHSVNLREKLDMQRALKGLGDSQHDRVLAGVYRRLIEDDSYRCRLSAEELMVFDAVMYGCGRRAVGE